MTDRSEHKPPLDLVSYEYIRGLSSRVSKVLEDATVREKFRELDAELDQDFIEFERELDRVEPESELIYQALRDISMHLSLLQVQLEDSLSVRTELRRERIATQLMAGICAMKGDNAPSYVERVVEWADMLIAALDKAELVAGMNKMVIRELDEDDVRRRDPHQ